MKRDAKMDSNHQNMEFAKTISHLALANQQLAEAHKLTLDSVQFFFNELKNVQPSINACKKTLKNIEAKKVKIKLKSRQKLLSTRTVQAKRLSSPNELAAFDDGGNDETDGIEKIDQENPTEDDERSIMFEKQKIIIQNLSREINETRQNYEISNKNLETLTSKFRNIELENSRLASELKRFQCEKIITEKKICDITEENKILAIQVSESAELRVKSEKAIEDANRQINELQQVIKTNNEKLDSQTDKISCQSNNTEAEVRSPENKEMIQEFKKQLMLKRAARQQAMAVISNEMERLRQELENEKLSHSEALKELQDLKMNSKQNIKDKLNVKTDKCKCNDGMNKTDKKSSEFVEASRLLDLLKISDEVTNDLWLQLERTDDLRFQLENNPEEHFLRINSLKKLSEETRYTLRDRKQQVNVLKDRLAQILVHLGNEFRFDESREIKEEINLLIEDIGRSRSLSDERSRILSELKEHNFKEIHQLRLKLDACKKNTSCLEDELHKAEDKINKQSSETFNLESQLGLAKADRRDLQNQMSLINSLFTQMLLGASSSEMDLDRLTQLLQENHDLISDIAKTNGTEAAALPKLLLDLIKQVDGQAREKKENKDDDNQQESIANNLPKVWRVLLELLSCHSVGKSGGDSPPTPVETVPDSCYKSVDTPAGPRLVISVSKTYIRLKDLILEKKHLQKEMNRMKQLNTHLESKLSEQEKRLSTVSDELSKTWNIVGRMQAQHQQLHTHEKILRYELQQKKKMLQELKKELEYCREKWELAREKNTNTEIEWRKLRREFTARKAMTTHGSSFNNSAESGFSDERDDETDEEDDEINKRPRFTNTRKRSKKDGVIINASEEKINDRSICDEFNEVDVASPTTLQHRILEANTVERVTTETEISYSSSNSTDNSEFAEECIFSSNAIEIESNDITHMEELSSEIKIDTEHDSKDECDSRRTENDTEVRLDNCLCVTTSVFTIGPVPNQSITEKSNSLFDKVSLPALADTTLDSGVNSQNKDDCSNVTVDRVPLHNDGSNNLLKSNNEASGSLDVRAKRLQSLEEQASWLVKKMNNTNRRSTALSSKLEELHETYRSIPPAPPMPDVLPTFRILSYLTLEDLNNNDEVVEENNL